MTIELIRTGTQAETRWGQQFAVGVCAWAAREPVSDIRVGTDRGWLTVKNPSAGTREVLQLLGLRPVSETELAVTVVEFDGESAIMGLHLLLARLGSAGLLRHTVELDGQLLATLRVAGSGGIKLAGRTPADTQVKLSRFATIRVADGELVLRSPRSPLAVQLTPAAAGLLGALSGWITPLQVAELLVPVPQEAADGILRLLRTAGLLAAGGAQDDLELTRAELAQWSPDDLALHSRIRGPRTVPGYGGTYRGLGTRDPEPVQPEPFPAGRATGGKVSLPIPDLDAISSTDPSLTKALESRRSVRAHDDGHPITVGQLGELLYRSARQRHSYPTGNGETAADRPYPSGGATHELEIYPLISHCEGLEPGLWHYRTDDHSLELVAEPDKTTALLVNQAKASSLMKNDPQVVLLVSARFGRVMFKYETIPYSLILKHVGVLYQTIYLVATAMGLAVCGLGGGDAEGFAAVSGRDYFTEGTVGEMVIGSPADDGALRMPPFDFENTGTS